MVVLYHVYEFQFNPMTPNDAAGHALKLFSQEAKLCDRHPNKIARINLPSSCNEKADEKSIYSVVPSNDHVSQCSKESSKSNTKYNSGKFVSFLFFLVI